MNRDVNSNAKENRNFFLTLAKKARDYRMAKQNPGPYYAWPMGLWFSIFFVVPLAIILCYSFMKKDSFGGVVHQFTFTAYRQMCSKAYAFIMLRTLWMSVISTLISMAIALPCGYAIARSKKQTFLLILVIIPFLTNSLIRIFAWMTILGENGLLNSICRMFFYLVHGITGDGEVFQPHKFMYTKFAVILVSIYMYLPYAILPVFTAVDRFDFSLLEAARDLGASKPKAMVLVLIPGIKSGIISALIFTFIPIFGNYTVPQLVGSTESYMLGNIIMDQITKARNLPLASAFSVILTLVSMAAILLMIANDRHEAALKKSQNKAA
ncbi:MAG: ABC transporter permease [Treponema sp.]|nr:ABC transporter permease [Treponema sp.]